MQAWDYSSSADLEHGFIGRLRSFPREPEMISFALRCISADAIRAYLGLYHRLRIVGRNHLDTDGSLVIVANHASHLDALCLLSALPWRRLHRAYPAAATDYFFVSLPRVALAVLAVNALPFDRNLHIRDSIRRCRELIAQRGNILVIFPEGTRTSTGAMGAFKPGIGKLVAGTTVPVVPCYIDGAFKAWPKGQLIPRPRRLRLVVGAPRTYASFDPSCESARAICDDLRRAVETLKGEHHDHDFGAPAHP